MYEQANEKKHMEREQRMRHFWNNETFESAEEILEAVFQHAQNRTTPSPPFPPLEGEGI
jgi:hypothetical protein